ncbi:effector-associated constant component EACC1 [Streptomyces viridosporus]|uniref:effector-associated constant component EACC1 n=1 Tax=Streptomyces viridosporus TaxID=67581 RepID=UPI003317E333
MELVLTVDEVVGGEAEALLRWLHEERDLYGQARVSLGGAHPPPPGGMGGSTLEIVNVVLSNSIALGSLVTTLVAWRSSRPASPPAVRIEVNGVPVTLNSDDPEVIRSLIETLRDADSGSSQGPDSSQDGGSAPSSGA